MTRDALSGLRIVELGEGIAPAYCGKLLADLGADVVKVEPPVRGDVLRRRGPFPGDEPHPEHSALFLYLNTNKLGMTLDPSCSTGSELLRRLLERADVVIDGLAVGTLATWGLDDQTLRQSYPRLVVTHLSPFGQTGPYARYRGTSLTVLAYANIAWGIGEPGRPPLAIPYDQADYQGGMAGATATMMALLARERSGQGQVADVAAAETYATLYAQGMIPTFVFLGVTGQRQGHRRVDHYPYTILPCKDGYVCLICREGRQWRRFVEDILGNPEWTQSPRYRNRRVMAEEYPDEVDALLAPWLMSHTKEEIFALCRQRRVPFAPVRTMDEVANAAELEACGFFVAVPRDGSGPLRAPGPPFRMSATPWRIRRPAPRLGEHNAAIFCDELGVERAELVALSRSGII